MRAQVDDEQQASGGPQFARTDTSRRLCRVATGQCAAAAAASLGRRPDERHERPGRLFFQQKSINAFTYLPHRIQTSNGKMGRTKSTMKT